ncbi:MAG TPA: hypothetical protein VGF40_05100, partial [Thermoanaerobaculia bacterium]
LTSEGCEAGARFLWSDVRAVSVVTRSSELDDLLALRFALRDGRTVEVNETRPGFTQLVQILPDVLAGFPDQNEWLYDATEADPESETLLYEAGGA